jgi:hypothetical protein
MVPSRRDSCPDAGFIGSGTLTQNDLVGIAFVPSGWGTSRPEIRPSSLRSSPITVDELSPPPLFGYASKREKPAHRNAKAPPTGPASRPLIVTDGSLETYEPPRLTMGEWFGTPPFGGRRFARSTRAETGPPWLISAAPGSPPTSEWPTARSRRAAASLERPTERDARQPVATKQRLPKAIGPDSASVRDRLAA